MKGVPRCSRCRKEILDEEDILWYHDKIYCPICYGEILKAKPAVGQIFIWIMVTFMIFCIILLWIL
ncbi:MAG: hypothetical protein HWN66_08250 [Candidatus Helarchaeota archaeon]|nr:hypothetical protein [Candidatus Helarchaeota archaeon]